ncbi:MAG: nitrogenase cofactor biosynthesis protein NifB [Desulfobacterales bacterium]|nr:nitrogenase cofactor biosynthesis protein NifB [Desulfobacterales bacterium]
MNIDNHPCFNPKACKDFGRVHLPVAPACNIQCNFCNRKFDCVNESRPGVSSSILSPDQAMAYLAEVVEAKGNISVVGIAGPGDPFANPVQTMETLRIVRQTYPDMLLCVASNGLNIGPHLDELAELKVSHVSITVNAVDPIIGEKIYSWVRDNKKTMGPELGARLLLRRQLSAIRGLVERGVMVKVNTIVLPGINDHHVTDIAREMSLLGVDLFNCMPYFPNEGANLSHLSEPSLKQMKGLRKAAREFIPQMTHCKRCRADAVGLLDDPLNTHLMDRLKHHANAPLPFPGKDKQFSASPGGGMAASSEPAKETSRTYVAVATREGVLVNQHLGEARTLSIYDISNDTPVMVEKRRMPKPGTRDFRWFGTAEAIKDCHTLLVSGIGQNPKEILTQDGLDVLEVNGMIEMVLSALKNGEDFSHLIVREHSGCGQCQGTGTGCM